MSKKLLQQLGYSFDNSGLMVQALTHRSAPGPDNERLEFLGDAGLGMVMAAELYHRYPRASEGELSRLRASLVNRESLAELAVRLKLGDSLRLGGGELKSGGFRRPSTLADALEAVFGAIYLDSDLATCREVILNLYQQRLEELPSAKKLKDAKTRLQEWLQARQRSLPEYILLETRGDPHQQVFSVECRVGKHRRTAEGSNRRLAEQAAAEKIMTILTEK